MPSSPSRPTDALFAQPFAHRGLHGHGRIENSRAAFTAAIDRGHGIELDVQISRDGAAMVFHDYELDRLTDATGKVADRDFAELASIPLAGADETIPTLPDILALIAGNAPLLIEVKSKDRDPKRISAAVAAALEGYDGPVGVMSFNPGVGAWFAADAPGIVRGLVVTEENRHNLRGRLERGLSLRRSRPDFLAYDVRDFPSAFAAQARARGLPVATWTVRTPDQRKTAAAHADQIIYEERG